MDERNVSERVRVSCAACCGPHRVYGPSFCPVCREQRAVMATLLSPRLTALEEAKLAYADKIIAAYDAEHLDDATGEAMMEDAIRTFLTAVRAEREKEGAR